MAASPKRSKTEQMRTVGDVLVGSVTVQTTLRLDQFSSCWWRHLVQYFEMVELLRLHLTCTGIRAHALPSKCLCVYLDFPCQLGWLQECQDSVERVIIRFCAALHDPTQVVTRLGACTSLKEWHFEQHPRGVTDADHTHLTAPIQVVVSQLTHLRTFLQQQPRYVCVCDGGECGDDVTRVGRCLRESLTTCVCLCRLVALRLEKLVCPHFASSFEWFPVTSLAHLHTLHLYNNFLDYAKIDELVTHLRGSSVTSLDLGQHRMHPNETLAIVEALTASNGTTHLVTLRLDVTKYADAQNAAFVGYSGVTHLETNVGLVFAPLFLPPPSCTL